MTTQLLGGLDLGDEPTGRTGAALTDATLTGAAPTGAAPTGAALADPDRLTRTAGRAAQRVALVSSRTQVVAAALTLLGALLLGAVLEVGVLGSLKHDRLQQIHYGQLREQLAKSVAPVGPTDSDGVLLVLGAPVAIVEIPRLHLREVVGEGTTAGVLIGGPGHLRSTVLPGQAGISVIYGRQAAYGGPFGRLATLRPGDALSVTTGQGRHLYKVLDLRRAGDPVPALRPGASRLVLATGDGTEFAPEGVLRLDADLLSPVQPGGAEARASGAVTSAERPMAGDNLALVPLVLWSQLLLLAMLAVVFLRARWGRWQTWAVGCPVLLLVGLKTADTLARLLPNLL